jgi:hypothetical protein
MNEIRGNSSQIDDRISTVEKFLALSFEWGMRSTPKWPGKLEQRGRAPEEDPQRREDEGKQKILKERQIERKRLIARHRERRKALL